MNQYCFQDEYLYQGGSTEDNTQSDQKVSLLKCSSEVVSPNTLVSDSLAQYTDKIVIGTKVTLLLLELKNKIKIYHWQTESYPEHIALDNLFDKLTKKNDEWVEVFQGKYGRIRLDDSISSIPLINLNDTETGKYLLDIARKFLSIRDHHFNESVDSDLSNIFDEIMGYLYRTKYLLSLR